MKYIRWFADVRLTDVGQVGGKNTSIGQMIADLQGQKIRVPDGFALVADAYWYVLEYNALREPIRQAMDKLTSAYSMELLHETGSQVRSLISKARIPDDLAVEIKAAYKQLSQRYKVIACDVAVRSSATAEDLPTASFAGQQETYLNIVGDQELLLAVTKSMASLFTDRAIVYRREQGFDHFKVALSVGVQKMVRSDKACAGVAFSLDTETGYKDAVVINGAYGLGELVVKGTVVPDEFVIHKPTLEQGFASIIRKRLGVKTVKMVYSDKETISVPVEEQEQRVFCLTDQEILELARDVLIIEKHYSALKKSWSPMDIEWAKDGVDGCLYIVQARPETIHATTSYGKALKYVLKASNPQVLATGQSIGQRIATGTVRVVRDVKSIMQVQDGDVIVTEMTDPDWVPAMKRAAAIITERGGRTCHAAIVSRELGIPALVGVDDALNKLHTADVVTVDCSQGSTGYVYKGAVPFETVQSVLPEVEHLPVEVMVNCADPDQAFALSFLPVHGVGLARLEFIITNTIGVHPMACVRPDRVTDAAVAQQIYAKRGPYKDLPTFFIETLAQGIAMIAAGFYPRPVIVRLSDFKTNEYRNLLGGSFFEGFEENPMLGFRGAARYCSEQYKDAFSLECAALRIVRERMGLTNVAIMVPFVRTVHEGVNVLEEMDRYGLQRGQQGLRVVMMCEIPSNVLLIDEFSKHFDGFSIGSNDLTQLTLGVDRDSALVQSIFDERDPAVKKMLALAIEGARKAQRSIGICGQGPSDYPELAEFLIASGINSLSLNQDSVIPFLMRYAK